MGIRKSVFFVFLYGRWEVGGSTCAKVVTAPQPPVVRRLLTLGTLKRVPDSSTVLRTQWGVAIETVLA